MRHATKLLTVVLLATATIAPTAHAGVGADNDRGLELVTPPDTAGIPVTGGISAETGDRLLWAGMGPLGDSANGGTSRLVATRSESGWTSRSILGLRQAQLDTIYGVFGYTADLTRFVSTASHAGIGDMPKARMVRIDALGTQTVLANFLTGFAPAFMMAASGDVEHVVYADSDPLAPEHQACAPACGLQLYDAGDGTPRIIGKLPDGSLPACGIPSLGSAGGGFAHKDWSIGWQNWVSADGSRVFFQAQVDGCTGPWELYLREGGAEGATTWVSEPIPGEPSQGATLLQASKDGTRVWFETTSRLSPDDANTVSDIYRYTTGVGGECLTCIHPSAGVERNLGGGVSALVAQEGRRVYFTSGRQLVEGEGAEGEENLYVLRDGVLRYVAATTPNEGISYYPFRGGFAVAPSLATPDGAVLLFYSNRQLTEHDNRGFRVLYRYDDRSGDLRCVMCEYVTPVDDHQLDFTIKFGPLGGATSMSADGHRIAFATPQALVPTDVNGEIDVYEWHDGRVGLVTDGRSNYVGSPPEIVGMTPSGRDLFVLTSAPLTDESVDADSARGVGHAPAIYDARIGGGFPAGPDDPEGCHGDVCQGEHSKGPRSLAEGSLAFGETADGQNGLTVRVSRMRMARGGVARLRVRVPAAGRLTASGRGVVRTSRRASRAGAVVLTVRLARSARLALRHKGRFGSRVRVAYKSDGGDRGEARIRLKFASPNLRSGRRGR